MLERSSLVIFTICSFLHNCEKLKTLLKQGDYWKYARLNFSHDLGISDVWEWLWPSVTIRTYTTDFYLFLCVLILESSCIMTHAFIFLLAFGPIRYCDSCAAHYCDSELHLIVHCDLLLQWHYCSCDAYCLRYSIVLVEYLVKLAG